MKRILGTNGVELLAPAGNLQSFFVALNSGADAIYLGASDFNARGNIENFSFENLKDAVRQAHLFGVRVYLTLNTLILDEEIEKVLEVVRKALDAKIDAFIVQDIGLAYLLSKKFEGIELHASTQMGIENLEGAEALKSIGFKRIVLARETPLSEIRRIKDNLDTEIEYFIQGALCVSFSGNCYLCSLLAGASGNRGRCKQFCRLPYTMKTGNGEKKGYLLSTKDFCMLPKLKELVSSGVDSLKIEGRARRSAYVGQAVTTYRKAIDNDFNFNEQDIANLKKVFNRGDYIPGYFGNDKIIYDKTQNHMGVEIGKVVAVKNGKKFNEVTISSKHNLVKDDSLKFFVEGKETASVNVKDVRKIKENLFIFTTTTLIPQGAKVSLISDKKQEDIVLSQKRTLPVEAYINCKAGERASLKLVCQNAIVCVYGENALEEAKNSPLTKEECSAQISKLGESFKLVFFDAELDNVFLRKAELNSLRRDAVKALEEKILENYDQNHKITEKSFKISQKNEKNNKKIIYSSSLTDLEKSIGKYDYIVYSPNVFDKNEISSFCQKHKRQTLFLDLPVIATKEDVLLFQDILKDNENLGVVANNYYALALTDRSKTIIGSEMNVFSSYAVAFYISQGFDKIVLSKEALDLSKIHSQGAELFVQTKVKHKLMHFKHCPIKEHIGGDCGHCRYKQGIKYSLAGQGDFLLERVKAKSCQFVLKQDKFTIKNSYNFGEVIEI